MDVTLDIHTNCYVNNQLADSDTPVYENFTVTWTLEKSDAENKENIDFVQTDGQKQVAAAEEEELSSGEENGAISVTITVLVNNRPVQLSGKPEYVYVDVFDYINFDLTRPKGKGIITTLNGRQAQYMEPIADGDIIEIYWQE